MVGIGTPLMWSLFAAFVLIALLVDFFDPEAQAAAIERLLDDPPEAQALAAAASQAALAYDHGCGLTAWSDLIAACS